MGDCARKQMNARAVQVRHQPVDHDRYALLIIGRYREQRAAGESMQDAAGRSFATAGATVVAAGLIVMVAIAGLLVVGGPYIGKDGPRRGDRDRRAVVRRR